MFYRDYLQLSYPASPANPSLSGFPNRNNILYCPSGVSDLRVAHTGGGYNNNPKWQEWAYDCPNTIDYGMPGCSVTAPDNAYMFWDFAKADKLWSYKHVVGVAQYEPLFSFDYGFMQLPRLDGGNGWQPHSGGSGDPFAAAGMNIMLPDGSGKWMPATACSLTTYLGYNRIYPIGYYAQMYPGFTNASYPNGAPVVFYFPNAGTVNNGGTVAPGAMGYTFGAP